MCISSWDEYFSMYLDVSPGSSTANCLLMAPAHLSTLLLVRPFQFEINFSIY